MNRPRSNEMFTLAEIESVMPVVRASVPPTPQYAWPLLRAHTGVEVVVKHENHTPIGAFKVRGGLVYFDRMKRERPQVNGIVTATRGNHGQSLAFAGARAGVGVTIVVPHGNSSEKSGAMLALGADRARPRLRRGEGVGGSDRRRARPGVCSVVPPRFRRGGCDLRP
jgi:threonine dehydratase